MTSSALNDMLVIDPASGTMVSPEPPMVNGRDYLTRLHDVGVNVASVTLAAHADGFDAFIKNVHSYLCLFEADPQRVRHVQTIDDVANSVADGRVGVVFGSQTGSIVGRDVWRWEIVRALGLRICCLTYSERNALADGCAEPGNRGLSADGRQAVQEMNRLGITIDISHVGDRSSLEAIEWSTKPVIASHSNVRAVSPSVRNLPADVMNALAQGGGVMGISPFSAMCARESGVRPTVDDYVDMVAAAVDAIGIDHVGIGTDLYESYSQLSWESSTKRLYPSPWVYDTRYADGFSQLEGWTSLHGLLRTRGFDDAEIAKLVGGNWRRVISETWLTEDVAPHNLTAKALSDTYQTARA